MGCIPEVPNRHLTLCNLTNVRWENWGTGQANGEFGEFGEFYSTLNEIKD